MSVCKFALILVLSVVEAQREEELRKSLLVKSETFNVGKDLCSLAGIKLKLLDLPPNLLRVHVDGFSLLMYTVHMKVNNQTFGSLHTLMRAVVNIMT